MQKLAIIALFFLATIQMNGQNLPEGNIATDRTKTNLNLGWKFHLGDDVNPTSKDFDDSSWENVALPHSLELVSYELDSVKESWVQKEYLRNVGWYRKNIKIDAKPSDKIFIEFEGVHNATEIWVNGKKAGEYKINGYIPFHFDITEFVELGADNIIVIKADNTYNQSIAPDPHRSDYVKFGGIYRDVYLVTTNKVHVNFNWESFDAGVHITTPTVNKDNGTVSVKTVVVNDNNEVANCKIETNIIDADGYVIKKIVSNKTISANSKEIFRQSTVIEDNYNLWSPSSPYLYRVYTIVYNNNKPVDAVENTFGFRKFSLEKGKGFVLNGEPLFLIGANRHQNYPNIGDAVPNSFHYNEALQYKNAGMNIIRLSHYTQDDAFIRACDELGIIIYEEVSTWIEWGDENWFKKLDEATRVMIRNHRNHPSIVFWGAGINHRGPVPLMQTIAKEEDPFRLTASASSPWNGVKNEGVVDIHATMDYRRTEFPEGSFSMVMEHGSSPNSETNQFHISRYKKSKNNIATITWVGADYNHLQQNTVQGDYKRDFMTTYGVLSAYRIPKPVYFWYQSELVNAPLVHIADETASTNGKVRVFSNCQTVKLYHNGNLIAEQYPDNDLVKSSLNHPSFTFKFNWKAGELKAVGYINGKEVTSHKRTKQEVPYKLKVEFNIPDQPFYAGGSDLRLAHAYVVDKNGEVITNATNKVKFTISGDGEFIDNGLIEANPATVYNGVASIYVRGSKNAGSLKVSATSKGLKSGSATISTTSFNKNEIERNAQPIFDYPISKVDVGGEKQLVQFDWSSWTNKSTYTIKDYGTDVAISSKNNLKWFGNGSSMLGDNSFMGADGVYDEKGNLILTFSALQKGTYEIVSYHHTRRKDAKMANNIEVTKNDVNGLFTKKADDHIVSYYLNDNTGERSPLYIKSVIESNGTNTISLEFKNLDKGDMWLNGFTIKRIK